MNKLIAFCTHFCLSSVYDHTGVSNVTLYSASVAAADSSSNVIIQYELKADMLYIIRCTHNFRNQIVLVVASIPLVNLVL